MLHLSLLPGPRRSLALSPTTCGWKAGVDADWRMLPALESAEARVGRAGSGDVGSNARRLIIMVPPWDELIYPAGSESFSVLASARRHW